MQNLILTAGQTAILFALIAVGAITRRMRLITDDSIKGMVNVLVVIVTPAVILDVFNRPFAPSMLKQFLIAIMIATMMHILLIICSKVLFRRNDEIRPVLRLASVFSNAGFMGIPLEYAIIGPEGVFYGVVYVAIFNVFIWSWGLREMKNEECRMKNEGESRGKWKMLVNPGTVAIAAALPIFLFSIPLPQIVTRPVKMLSDLNTPLAMLVIGYYLAGADLRRILRTPAALGAAFLRLVASPLLLIALLYPFKEMLDGNMMLAMVIAAASPVAAMVTMFSSRYKRDVDLSVGLVSGTTLLSILTLPPVIALAIEWLS